MDEIWKPIPGYENYEASSLGRIRSHWNMRRKGVAILKSQVSSRGYHQLRLAGRKAARVHRLVMLAFHGPNEMCVVNHKNGIKTDNRLENLEYVTKSQDIAHAYATGLRKPTARYGENSYRSKLTEADVRWIRENYTRNGAWNTTTLGKKFGLCPQSIHKIIKRKCWAWLGGE